MAEEVQEKTRYSDEELAEFKEIILQRLEKSRKLYKELTENIRNADGSDGDESSILDFEDGATSLSLETNGLLAQKEMVFIKALEAALVRIENKTYGICRETGKLIPKERLRLMPHATLSVEAKMKRR